jgi:hypothetical protein
MKWYEMMESILAIFPDATTGEDNDGQLIIYTDVDVKDIVDDFGLDSDV